MSWFKTSGFITCKEKQRMMGVTMKMVGKREKERERKREKERERERKRERERDYSM